MKSPLESPAESTAAAIYGGNTALDAEIYDDADCRRLNGVIKDIIEDHGLQGADKERAEEFTRKELYKLYEQPMVLHLEAVLHKRITKDEARHVLFFPSEDQAVYYQALIRDPPKGAPPGHPQRAVQIPHLSLLYMQHWKRWEFVSAFVLAGGLHSLCSLFAHDNSIVRMKAINTLVNITAHRAFDWFRPPPRHRGGGTVEARLHRALLGLRSDPAFISGLIANSWGASGGGRAKTASGEGGTFPGACLICLELLAMWLSWVRALHTADGTLRLSRPLFRAIEEWGGVGGEQEGSAWGKVPWELAPPQDQLGGEGRLVETAGEERAGALMGTTTAGIGDGFANDEAIAPGPDVDCREGGEMEAIAAREGRGGRGGGRGVAVADTSESSSSERTAEGEPRAGIVHERTPSSSSPPTPAAQAPGKSEVNGISGHDAEQTNEPKVAPVAEETCRGRQEIIETENEERASVVELAGKLIADFGRFPPAEQEWKEVVEAEKEDVFSKGGGHGLEACASHSSSSEAVSRGQEITAASSEQGVITTDQASGGTCVSVNDGGVKESPARIDAHVTDSNGDSQQPNPDTVVEEPVSKATEEAGALKIAGNESFRTMNFQAAYDAYTAALDTLDAAGLVPPPPPPPPPSAPSTSLADGPSAKEGLRLSEGVALRGILHRNRAAVALRMFESCAAAAAAGGRKIANSQRGGGKACGVGVGDDPLKRKADRHVLHAATRTEVGLKRAGGRALPPGEEERREGEEEDDEEAEEEKALASLERCERDCLSAIEIDAADKKAHFRLSRCREMRRRCRRQGLAASLGEEKGVEQDRRRQERKEALMAKVLARTEGTHEIVGGSGGGGIGPKSTPTETAAAATAAAINGTVVSSSREDIDAPPVENTNARATPDAAGGAVSGDSGDEVRADCDGDGGSEGGPLVEVEIKLEIDYTVDTFSACRAPREGGELKGTSTPSNRCDLALAGDVTETAACRAESTLRVTTLAGASGGRDSVATVGCNKLSNGSSKPTKKESVADVPVRPRSAKMGGTRRSNASAVPPGAARADVAEAPSARLPSSRLRNLRRRLERLTAQAAGTSAAPPREEGQGVDRGEEAAKRVWDFISSVSLSSDCGSASLENLYGDGITADSLVGLVRGLRYACGLDETGVAGERAGGNGEGEIEATHWNNNEQASKIFLQLAKVKRVSLASAMCSASDKRTLQDVSDHIRRHQRFQPITDSGGEDSRPIRCDDHDDVDVAVGKEEDARANFEAAASALGLV